MGIQGVEGREIRGQVGMNQLENLLRALQVLEPMRAHVPQTYRLGQTVPDQLGRGLGDQYLAAMGDGPEAGAHRFTVAP